MFTELSDTNFAETISTIETGIVICFKKLCPHCKNMEKVLEKFAKKNAGVPLFNLDSEENPKTMEGLKTDRIPTILVIKNGTVAAQKSGLMNPKEMIAFYEGV